MFGASTAQVTAAVVSDEELREMFDVVDADGGGSISQQEFLELMKQDEGSEISQAEQVTRPLHIPPRALHE